MGRSSVPAFGTECNSLGISSAIATNIADKVSWWVLFTAIFYLLASYLIVMGLIPKIRPI